MPRIPETTVDEVRERADIVEVAASYMRLQKRGADHWACCPFHKEKTASLKVSSSRQSFYCFGCHKSGNVFTLVQELENLEFVEAVTTLAQRFGVQIPEPDAGRPEDREAARRRRTAQEAAHQLLDQMARWYQHTLQTPAGQPAREYLAGRGIDAEAVAAFGIGYAPDSWDAALRWAEQLGFSRDQMVAVGLAVVGETDKTRCYDRFRGRLMFPIHDPQGRVVGFSGRVLEADAKTAKYVNTPETDYFHKGRLLYAFHRARAHFREHGRALLCEGQLDVVACHRAGLTHAVSAQGTAFTEHHARLLRRATEAVTVAFDADPAGRKAAVGTITLLHSEGLRVSVVSLPDGDDPDSLFRRGGAAALQEAMANAVDAVQFVYDLAAQQHDARTPVGKDEIVNEVLPAIASVDSPVAQAAYCRWLSDRLSVPVEAVAGALERFQRQQDPQRRGRVEGEPRGAGAAGAGTQARATAAAKAPRQAALTALFDLALHHESVALELSDILPPVLVDDSAVGRALNLVLAAAAHGDWKQAGAAVTGNLDLVASPEVARILVESGYRGLDPAAVDPERRKPAEERLHAAAADCIATLRLEHIAAETEAVRQALAAGPGEDEAHRLTTRFQELIKEKREAHGQRLRPPAR